MEPEHSKQGTARGSAALSGKKPRLLAMALLLAVLAMGGAAMGEEKRSSGSKHGQESTRVEEPAKPSVEAIDDYEGIMDLDVLAEKLREKALENERNGKSGEGTNLSGDELKSDKPSAVVPGP
ncbi:MAG: hypothetical protein OEV92_06070, partial [Nitrospinota bacterium]|nr:hypothetical protein [Nitrospinota bacterium]